MTLTAVCPKAVVLLLLIRCWVLLPFWDSVIDLCFVVRYFHSCFAIILIESWLLYFVCLPGVSWLLCCSSLRCHGLSGVCDRGISWPYSLTIFFYINWIPVHSTLLNIHWISVHSTLLTIHRIPVHSTMLTIHWISVRSTKLTFYWITVYITLLTIH